MAVSAWLTRLFSCRQTGPIISMDAAIMDAPPIYREEAYNRVHWYTSPIAEVIEIIMRHRSISKDLMDDKSVLF